MFESGTVEASAEGAYFVKDTCIDCDLCRQTAPFAFGRKHVGNAGYTYVERQPLTLQEERMCRESLDACPVEAIGYKLA
jgi:ferredoxin